ncbi:MAG: hypothetical protein K2K89_00460 [Ruminococcus sp.]|nr:hypothetical protein [Ruminococcus sp.]
MTGLGTENDPFLVDNWEDFSTIDTDSADVYVRWADGGNKIIDFNDTMPEGFSETVAIPAHVDFNGWTLKNFHSTASSAFMGVSSSNHSNVNNLILEKFYYIGQYLLRCINFQNCIFSGICNGASPVIFGYYSNFSCCSANLQMHSDSELTVFLYSTCRNSDTILDISGNRCNIFFGSQNKAYNSRFSGKIRINSSSNILVNIGYSSIFNLDSNQPLACSGVTGISVFNADTAQKTSNSPNNFVGVTSEQLKNAEYLYSIGFPIGVD